MNKIIKSISLVIVVVMIVSAFSCTFSASAAGINNFYNRHDNDFGYVINNNIKLTVTAGTSSTNTVFKWNNVYGAKNCELVIRTYNTLIGNAYKTVKNATSGTKVKLPAGTYWAYVVVNNRMSNVVMFTVKGDQPIVVSEYTVSYDANGGSEAPLSQKKTEGTDLTLSSEIPSKDGFDFVNWNTEKDGSGTSYAPGAKYTLDKNVTLYAQWKAKTYTVSFDANGGDVAPATQTKTNSVDLILSSEIPSKDGFDFVNWNTEKDGSGTSYAPGAKYTLDKNVTLYAQWKEQEVVPEEADIFVFKLNDENVYYVNLDVKFTIGNPARLDENKNTLVPLRAIIDAVGVEDLKYDEVTRKITFTGFDGYKVEMTVGSTVCTLTKNDETITLEIPAPVIENNSAMLPLRDTANLVGGYVKYENHYIIVSKDPINEADIAGYIEAYEAK